ncbi:MAG: Nif3-like dinuclear metal center hexameric protein [Bacteroidales bacterium]|nr:Nif3-like dinuclear metal center hexameric protein [Bacteroidales bacterium]
MKVKDIVGAVEEFAPAAVQEGWDNSGLIIGSPEACIDGVLVAFDCTPETVDEAVREGCGMIVTHHPLIFKGLKKIIPGDPVCDAVIKAVKAGIAVYAAHTSADKVPGGVSFAMAEKLGLKDAEILSQDPSGTGLGVVGDLPEPLPAKEFIALLKKAFGCAVVKCSAPVAGLIGRVALCGGSGAEFIPLAQSRGAQAYVSADISYHNFFTPEGFMVADIGHFESEVEITGILFSKLKKNFPNFAVRISTVMHNPVYYF